VQHSLLLIELLVFLGELSAAPTKALISFYKNSRDPAWKDLRDPLPLDSPFHRPEQNPPHHLGVSASNADADDGFGDSFEELDAKADAPKSSIRKVRQGSEEERAAICLAALETEGARVLACGAARRSEISTSCNPPHRPLSASHLRPCVSCSAFYFDDPKWSAGLDRDRVDGIAVAASLCPQCSNEHDEYLARSASRARGRSQGAESTRPS
jgi:hypothetical protein